MTNCGNCLLHWGGMNTTFTGITAFDAHRRGGKCISTADAGLTLSKRSYECYGYPSDETGAWWGTGEDNN